MHPRTELLGIYAPSRSPERVDQFIRGYLGELRGLNTERLTELDIELRAYLADAVLIEVLVHDRDANFDVGGFTQQDPSTSDSYWQVAWAEVYLTPDGSQRACERWSGVADTEPLRIAFWVHFWRQELGLASSYGPVECDDAAEMPERLWRLAPYELPD
jgi:hypothetical protein